MIFVLLRRIFREHAGAHFWVPIVVVFMLSFFFDLVIPLWRAHQLSLSLLLSGNLLHAIQLVFADHGRELLSIYLAFAWVVWHSVKKASDVRWTLIGDLSDNLEDADRYFAIGTIPLREWFEPNALLYLATIIQRQTKVTSFRHERVLIFYDESDLEALQASY